MKTPISGSFSEVPAHYTYSTEIATVADRLSFSSHHNDEFGGDTYYDRGDTRPVLTQVAQAPDGTSVAWVWSPATGLHEEMGTDELGRRMAGLGSDMADRIWIGYADGDEVPDPDDWPLDALTDFPTPWGSRPGICYDDGVYYVGYISKNTPGKVVVRSIDPVTFYPVPLLESPPVIFTDHGIADTNGASVAMIAQDDFWIGYYDAYGSYRLKHYFEGSWPTDTVVSVHGELLAWHNSCFSAQRSITGTGYLLSYQHEPGLAVTRYFDQRTLSRPMVVMGASSDYAYQSVRVCGLTFCNGKYFAVVERGFENSDGGISNWFTTLMYSGDGNLWSDFAGVTDIVVRGGFATLGVFSLVIGPAVSHLSLGSYRTGNADWTVLDGVLNWELNAGVPSTAMQGSCQVLLSETGVMPDAGDWMRKRMLIHSDSGPDEAPPGGGALFDISMESIDRAPLNINYAGNTGSIMSRGLLKNAVVYAASVDEAYESGQMRWLPFTVRNLVTKYGTWSRLDDSTMTVDSLGDKPYAIAIVAESLPIGDFQFQARMSSFHDSDTLVIFYEDSDNHWRVEVTAGQVRLHRVLAGHPTMIASHTLVGDVVPFIMVRYAGDSLQVYFSEPTTLAHDDWDLGCSARWVKQVAWQVNPRLTKHHVGVSGLVGATFRHLFVHAYGVQQTVGSVAQAIGARCGVEIDVLPQLSVQGEGYSTGGLLYEYATELYGLDVRAVVNTTGGYLDFSFSSVTPDILSGSGGLSIRVGQSAVRIRLPLYDGGWTFADAGVFRLPDWMTMEEGDHIRLCIMRIDNLSSFQFYLNHRLVWSAPLSFDMTTGYLSVSGPGLFKELEVPGLSYPVSTHIWQYRRTGLDEIKQLVDPFLWGLIEQSNGRVLLCPIRYDGGSLGDVAPTSEVISHMPDDTAWVSAIKIVGAEVYGVYIDGRTLDKGVRVVEQDSPHLWTERECLDQAYRFADYLYSNLHKKTIVAFLDPRIEVLDRLIIDGERHVVDGYSFQVSSPRTPSAIMRVNTRMEVPALVAPAEIGDEE